MNEGGYVRTLATFLLASVPRLCLTVPAVAAELEPAKSAPSPCPDIGELETQGYRIGSIDINVLPIFDDDPEGKHQTLYRLADRLHIDTRDPVDRVAAPVQVRSIRSRSG
jgi:hypothetical protein